MEGKGDNALFPQCFEKKKKNLSVREKFKICSASRPIQAPEGPLFFTSSYFSLMSSLKSTNSHGWAFTHGNFLSFIMGYETILVYLTENF